MSSYSNESITALIEAGIAERFLLEMKFRELNRVVLQLGGTPADGCRRRSNTRRRTQLSAQGASHPRNTLGTGKRRSEGVRLTPSDVPCAEPRHGSARSASRKARSPFRKALDDAREQLALGRRSGPTRMYHDKGATDWTTVMCMKGNSANLSISYEETPQNVVVGGAGGKAASSFQTCVGSRTAREEARPPEDVASSLQQQLSVCSGTPVGTTEYGQHDAVVRISRQPNMKPRQNETVRVQAKRGCARETQLQMRLEVVGESGPGGRGGPSRPSSRQGSNTSTSRRERKERRISQPSSNHRTKTGFVESPPLLDSSKKNTSEAAPFCLGCSMQSRRKARGQGTSSCAGSGEEKPSQHEVPTSLRVSRRNGKSEFLHGAGHGETGSENRGDEEPEGTKSAGAREKLSWVREGDASETPYMYGMLNADEKDRKRVHNDGQSRHERDPEKAEDQRRWRKRGGILWHTFGNSRHPRPTFEFRQQADVARPYRGLFERSLQANGIDPFKLRTFHCCGCHGNCKEDSLLWHRSRGRCETRAPSDGHPDRLESGRILDSLNQRAEILGTSPPTPLRAKAAWMENPGDPSYSLLESTKGMLSGFCAPGPLARNAPRRPLTR